MKSTRITKYIIIASMPVLLVSCFSAKEYVQSDEAVLPEGTATYRTDQLSQDSLSMAEVSWRELFTDPVLTQYIERGLENNIDIRVALQQIVAAEAYAKQAKAGYFPTLSANARYTHQELAKNSPMSAFMGSSQDQYELTGNLAWEIDVWGKIRSNKRAFQASYLQTVAAHQVVKTRLIANIASVYYQLLTVDEQIAVTQETVATRRNSLETTKALMEAGTVTQVGVKQTEAQLYTAEAILVDLKNQAFLLENSLSILLGESPNNKERGTLEEQQITTELVAGVPAQLLANRPDVIAAELQLRQTFELTNVARSNFYPALTLSAGGGFQSLEFDQLFSANSLFANLVGGLAQPILNGRKIRTQYEVAKVQQEQARLNFKQAVLTASKEVSDAMFTFNTASEKIAIKQKEYDAYALAAEYSQELLNNGLANYLEVLRAQENVLNTNLDLVNAKNRQLQSVIDLYAALGGGWK
ncbi:efflux transporter, outer membrane factor (OMF) lipoprotein, NodT family [Arenibacter nanhaiticus]|uniref:Efflux transporter, outer membrane factor (OMF) lipoprotein, NodT family n=1 Tax=Arenibacter nanhaiticus TaxID=558155 RepID=A0A1M6AM60_9FLAO|nr:efflux transporter outer membrane subunit [Arenibacter nanhaiticus]SHI37594.1 efflux transporter, outer membrane factor (OMF) lipoprotein, NodT family [Arenibacter nanhaiticus]